MEDENENEEYKKEKYSREEEHASCWELASLAQQPSQSVQGFFPAAEFCVHRTFMDKKAGMHWPSYLQISSDHTHPRWRFHSHRRCKNILVTMEWQPDADTTSALGAAFGSVASPGAAQLAAAAFTEGQRQRLSRVFDMYDPERRGALGESQLLLVLSNMGLQPDEDPADRAAVTQATRCPSLPFAAPPFAAPPFTAPLFTTPSLAAPPFTTPPITAPPFAAPTPVPTPVLLSRHR